MVVARLKAKAVQERLVRRHLTQNGLALKLGISSGYMSQLMRGQKFPSPSLRQEIAVALREDVENFDVLYEIIERPTAEKAGVA